jgi:hypothetical protein
LIEVIASHPGLVDILNRIEHTPKPTILFAGVQFLMMGEGGSDLARYYPSLSDDPTDDGVEEAFVEFVLAHEESLVEIGRTRYTQTNECRRCVALLSGVWATRASEFHLVDIGTSAGLNLLLDRYRYLLGRLEWGPESPVMLTTDLRSGRVEPRPVEILSRTGIDLHPVDPSNPDDARWLDALIWPENHDRRRRLRSALGLANQEPMRLVAGDVLEVLPDELSRIPGDEPVVVMNSFILNQLTHRGRERVAAIIEAHRTRRPIYRVSCEWLDPEDAGAAIEVDNGSGLSRVGLAHPHGDWIELYARP